MGWDGIGYTIVLVLLTEGGGKSQTQARLSSNGAYVSLFSFQTSTSVFMK